MILKQHLEIDGLEFDIWIRKPPPVDEAGGKLLDRWMRVIVNAVRQTAVLTWDQLSDEALLNVEQQASAQVRI